MHFLKSNYLFLNKVSKKLLCLFLCIIYISPYDMILLYSKPPFFFYRNFKNYDEYLSFIKAFKNNYFNYLKLENELKSLDILNLFGGYSSSELFRLEDLRGQFGDFSLRCNLGDSNIKLSAVLINTFKKDLEIFLFLFGTCSRFYNMKVLAPRFFDLFYEIFEGNYCFDYLKSMCDFINYEQRRQKFYLKLQLQSLQNILTTTKLSLDYFKEIEEKPEIFFFLNVIYNKLIPLNDIYNKIYSEKQ